MLGGIFLLSADDCPPESMCSLQLSNEKCLDLDHPEMAHKVTLPAYREAVLEAHTIDQSLSNRTFMDINLLQQYRSGKEENYRKSGGHLST